MKSQDAIAMLQKMRQDKEKNQTLNSMHTMADSFTGLKNILVGTMADLTELVLKNNFTVTVKNFPNKQDKLLKEMNQNLILINKTLSDILLINKADNKESDKLLIKEKNDSQHTDRKEKE